MRSISLGGFRSGNVSIIGRTSDSTLNFSVSSESVAVPDGQPRMERRAPMSSSGDLRSARPPAPTHHQLAVDAQSAEHRAHALGIGHRREDHLRAAELGQLFRRILRRAVDVDVRAELLRQRLLVRAARDRDGPESHLRRELHAKMAEAADAQHRDQIAGARAAVAQRVECRDAGTQQRRRVLAISAPPAPRASASNGATMYSA